MDEQFTLGDQPELFQAQGQLTEEDILFIEETKGLGLLEAKGVIVVPLRDKSQFSIGDPVVLPLAEYFQKSGQTVPIDIQLQMQRYEFYQVELACSFQAARGCRFHDASFALNLETIPADPNAPPQAASANAIAYDLFPLRVEDECRISIKQSLGPEITFGFDHASFSLKLPNKERSREYVTYQSRIVAFDLRTSWPKWQFTRTDAHEIEGSQELFMILRKPKGTHVKATFSLAANIQFTIAGLGLDLWPLVMVFRHRSNPNQPLTDAPSVPLDLLV